MQSSYIIGNWKMNLTDEASRKLAVDICDGSRGSKSKIILCPSHVSLATVRDIVVDCSGVELGAQDVFYEPKGAYTGEVSGEMLVSVGCKYVIIGHSERRSRGETDDVIEKKFRTAVRLNLVPIFCVGETAKEREAGETNAVIKRQVESIITAVAAEEFIVAYEPRWAISTSGKTAKAASFADIEAVLPIIKSALGDLGGQITIIYGGSVHYDNVKEFVGENKLDGALVGAASLHANEFLAIIKAVS